MQANQIKLYNPNFQSSRSKVTSTLANDSVVYCVIITGKPLENTACEFLDTTRSG
jgi:hypothetical protein